jgi:predicted DNA-binding transcriptional regulator AlpA
MDTVVRKTNTSSQNTAPRASAELVRHLSLAEVLAIFPVSRSTWYEGVKNGKYPKAVKLSERRVGWAEPELVAWQQSRMNA